MALFEDLRNKRVIISSLIPPQTLADTLVKSFDKLNNAITVSVAGLTPDRFPKVAALIFTSKGVFDCMGTVKTGHMAGEVVISLYKSEEKNDRAAVRYDVNMFGVLNEFTRDKSVITRSFAVNIINMSSSGILFRAPAGNLKVNDVVKITSVAKGQRLAMTGEIVRKQNTTIQSEEYGCRLFSVLPK